MYKPVTYVNNSGLYINSQQKINTAVYIHRTSTATSHIGPNLPSLNAISDERTTHKQPQFKFCSSLLLLSTSTA